jgi:hypothetical protein
MPSENSFNHPRNVTFMIRHGFLAPDADMATGYAVWGKLIRAASGPVAKWEKMTPEQRIEFKEKVAGVLEFRAPQPVAAE